MNKFNILITSAGRRVSLVSNFKSKLKKFFPFAKVFTTDINPEFSAACSIADKSFKTPNSLSDNYIASLKKIANDNDIGMIVPTNDNDLIKLSENIKLFESLGTKVIISSKDLINLCRDKRKTKFLCNEYGLKYPKIFNSLDINFPCFSKPYDGSSSKDIYLIRNIEEFKVVSSNNPNNIFMEYISDTYIEYTCDLYFDKNSKLKCIVPRERLQTRAGEVSKGITRKNFICHQLFDKLSILKGAKGCITLQCFANLASQDLIVIEINPRFGGGVPLTLKSGAEFIDWIILEYFLNLEIDFFDNWTNDLLMLRYDENIFKKL